jgi:thiol reductant ABC exporter CydC subunit
VRRLLLAALAAAVTDLAGIGLLGTAAWLIARAAQRPPIVALGVAIVLVRAFAIAKGTLRYVERLLGHDAALRVLAALRTRVYATLATVPTGGLIGQGDLLARLVSDVDGVQDALLRCAIPAAVAVLVAVATIAFTLVYLPAAALVLAAGLLLAGLLLPAGGYLVARRSARRIAATRGGYLSASVDILHGSADLAGYGATGTALAAAARAAGELARLQRATGTAQSALGALGLPVPALTAVAVCLVAMRAPGVGPVMVAVLAFVALGAVETVLPLTGAAVRLADLRGALERVRELLGTGRGPIPVHSGPSTVHSGPVAIELKGVSVRYQSDRGLALDGLDLDLPAGRRIAVVGPSGAGKSTLLGLLAGSVEPSAGTLAITPEGDERWRLAGGVLADAYVFHASVRENLTLGRTDFDDDDLLAALTSAGLPMDRDELDRQVGQDGAQVSGGQRQRVLLARALLVPPPVVLLDEPTEGLDPDAADDVLKRVLAAVPGHSVVLVTHRLADLDAFDEVLVLSGGRIGQRGTHTELLQRPGWYSRWHQAHDVAGWYACPTPSSTAT